MKRIAISLTLSLSVLRAAADVFIAPSNELVYLSVPANQAMLISSVNAGQFGNTGGSVLSLAGLIVLNGVTNTIQFVDSSSVANWTSGGPYAINGPCQIAFVADTYNLTPAAVLVSYNLLTNSLLHSLIVQPGSTNVISVPAGKSIRFLKPTSEGATSTGFIFENGTNTVFGLKISNGAEFTGPLTITKIADYYSGSQLISYYFTDEFFAVPDTGYISGPTGSFEIAVEKSVDLSAWCPVVVYNTGSDQKAFYRLRITK